METDTIVAVATAPGNAAVAVLRLSGNDAWAIAQGLTPGQRTAWEPRRAIVRRLEWDGRTLDEALVLPFRGPASFTGEDVVELHVHGGQKGVERVLRAARALGARPAQPGEFTRRALMNGKLDLLRAEGIAELVRATSDAAWDVGQDLLAGRLSQRVEALRAALVEVLVLLEAGLDFALEEHVAQTPPEVFDARLGGVASALAELLGTWRDGRIRVEGMRIAILGRPNAGKSTLFNQLYGSERAIVSEVAGTTRDWLEESIEVGGLVFRVIDTAGLRATGDRIESIGVERALEVARRADATLLVVDATEPDASRALWEECVARGPTGVVMNQVDRVPAMQRPEWLGDALWVATSCTEAPEAARTAVHGMLLELARAAGWSGPVEATVLVRERQRDAVARAAEAVERAREAVWVEAPLEMVALDARLALDALGELVGAVTTDDLLHKIFSDFCVGK